MDIMDSKIEQIEMEDFSEQNRDKILAGMILEEVLPQIIVAFELDEIYIKNPKLANKKIKKIVDEGKLSGSLFYQEDFLVTLDFKGEKRKLLNFIKKSDKSDFSEFPRMFLFQSVYLFESMINHHLQLEIMLNYKLEIKEINNRILYNLRFDDKLGWLLEMICGKNFTKSKHWNTLKPFITARNFFIHYKPETSHRLGNYLEYCTPKSIKTFLDASSKCHSFLLRSRTEKLKEYEKRLELTKRIYVERNKPLKCKKYIEARG